VTGSRVGTLKIHLRVPYELGDDTARLKQTVERDLVVRVLEELERILHREHGAEAVIRIQRLALRWQLEVGELFTPELIARLARDLSQALLAEVSRTSVRDQLRPRPDRIAVFANEAHAIAALVADEADRLPVHWVHAGTTLARAWERAVAGGAATLDAVVTWLTRMERLEAGISEAPDPALTALATHVAAAAPMVALVRARRTQRQTPLVIREAVPRGGEPREVLREAQAEERPERQDPPATLAPPSNAGQRAERKDARATPSADSVANAPVVSDMAAVAAPSLVLNGIEAATSFAGLFYLAGRVLELGLAEQLWEVGVAETRVLAHIAAVFVDDLDDPAWRWFGGTFDDQTPSLAGIPTWATDEVIHKTQHELGLRLVRFGVTTTPASLASQLDRLAADCRPSLPLEPACARLVARSVAAVVMMTCARLGVAPSVGTVRDVCARPGRLVRTPEALHVVIPMAFHDIEHRRAGLDHNPGYLPWLRSKLLLELTGGVEL
jgi:hypothetical protein